jgi:hypothetical protein
MTEDTERVFEVRIGSSPRTNEWILSVLPLDPWTDAQRRDWMTLIQDAFIHLAVVGGLCGQYGNPLAEAFGGEVEVWEVDDCVEWRFGELSVDPASVSLLLNLCEWATLNIAPAVMVEVLVPFSLTDEPEDRPLPQRCARLSFPVEETGQGGEGLSIQFESVDRLTGPHVSLISGLLQPWQTALFREGFALPTLPAGESEVRPSDPPIVVVDDLWSWNFEVFSARYEAVDVFLNCLERVHHTICRIKTVAVE